jgi:hypothetical protein
MRNVADPTLLERLPSDELLLAAEVPVGFADPGLEHERLRMLAAYSRFQIGLYTAVAAAVCLLAVWSGIKPWKLTPVLILALAGLAVGVVARNLLDAREVASFRQTRIKPRLIGGSALWLPVLRRYHAWKGWRAEVWQRLAGGGFWLAVLTFLGLALAGAYVPAGNARTSPPPPAAAAAAAALPPPPIGRAEAAPLRPRAEAAPPREAFIRARPPEARRIRAKPAQRPRKQTRSFPQFDGNR